VPSVMMFIPSVDGVSHCEREFSTDEDMVAGVEALTEVARELVFGALVEEDAGEAASTASASAASASAAGAR
jgi:beta-ureidopropionase / N-carbamoyl-L-amino-acid hydrolase